MAAKFKHPSEYPKKKNRVPISARLDSEIKTALEDAAKKGGLSFAELIENVLEDYHQFLKSSKARGK
jgi:hypothetical protein